MGPAGVVIAGEGSSGACSSVTVAAVGWRASQRLRVWWKRSTLPHVWGCSGAGLTGGDPQAGQLELDRAAATSTRGSGEDGAVVGQQRGGQAVAVVGDGLGAGVQALVGQALARLAELRRSSA
jgi:hypothetical protein